MERKIGKVYSANPKGWFFIYVTPQERYFLHISELKLDRMLLIGETVNFEVAPPRKPGQMPCAVDARPIVTDEVGGAL
jgi:hypothetical protein